MLKYVILNKLNKIIPTKNCIHLFKESIFRKNQVTFYNPGIMIRLSRSLKDRYK